MLLKMQQKNLDTFEEVIYQCPDVTSQAKMGYCVNDKLDDNNKNYLNEVTLQQLKKKYRHNA